MDNLIRPETHKERYQSRIAKAKVFSVEIACINLQTDENVGYLIRAASCFGAQSLHVVGRIPEYGALRRSSTGHNNFVNIIGHKQPSDLIQYCRENNRYLISAELTERSENLYEVDFPADRVVMFVVGHETLGVPEEILFRSDKIIYIPMVSTGYCLNTSQTGNILLSEFLRRYYEKSR